MLTDTPETLVKKVKNTNFSLKTTTFCSGRFHFSPFFNITSVHIYKTLLLKSRKLRKWIFVLKLFVITIVFTILSLRELVYVFHILFIAD